MSSDEEELDGGTLAAKDDEEEEEELDGGSLGPAPSAKVVDDDDDDEEELDGGSLAPAVPDLLGRTMLTIRARPCSRSGCHPQRTTGASYASSAAQTRPKLP